MKFTPTRLHEVVIIEPRAFEDARGSFMETWVSSKFATGGIDESFVQDNHSTSNRWVLRGLHYQIRQPQGKLVRVVCGEVFDVAVDLRRSSKTFAQWVGARLSAADRRMLWIPPGFAHGFLALSERVDFLYKCTDYYDPTAERALRWDDPEVGIEWPMPPGARPIISEKDAAAPGLAYAECFS